VLVSVIVELLEEDEPPELEASVEAASELAEESVASVVPEVLELAKVELVEVSEL
jgi:hypothetical protein